MRSVEPMSSAGADPSADCYAVKLLQLVQNNDTRNVLLAGPWGSGKTHTLRQLRSLIPTDTGVIWLEPSAFIGASDPMLDIASHLVHLARHAEKSDDASLVDRLKKWGEWAWSCLGIMRRTAGTAAVRALPLIVQLCKGYGGPDLPDGVKDMLDVGVTATTTINPTDTSSDTGPVEPLHRTSMRALLMDLCKAYGKKNVVLMVDDMDRTRPDVAFQVLHDLYHLILPHEDDEPSNWPLKSVWAVNVPVLEDYLRHVFQDMPTFDPNAYLMKVFGRRFNLPPILQSDGPTLWSADFSAYSAALGRISYSVLGNRRLHARVRMDLKRAVDAGVQNRVKGATMETKTVRLARLVILCVAFPVFRDRIAPYDSMWPVFVNALNQRWRSSMLDTIRNPNLIDTDSTSLGTLLVDLGALTFTADSDWPYGIIGDEIQTLQNELTELWKHGI